MPHIVAVPCQLVLVGATQEASSWEKAMVDGAKVKVCDGTFGEVSNEVSPPLQSPWGDYGRIFTLGVVSVFSKFVVSWMNRATVSNYGRAFARQRESPFQLNCHAPAVTVVGLSLTSMSVSVSVRPCISTRCTKRCLPASARAG